MQPVFSKESSQKAEKILNGLTAYGSYDKPEREVPLVMLCTPDKLQQMKALVSRMRPGKRKVSRHGKDILFFVR